MGAVRVMCTHLLPDEHHLFVYDLDLCYNAIAFRIVEEDVHRDVCPQLLGRQYHATQRVDALVPRSSHVSL